MKESTIAVIRTILTGVLMMRYFYCTLLVMISLLFQCDMSGGEEKQSASQLPAYYSVLEEIEDKRREIGLRFNRCSGSDSTRIILKEAAGEILESVSRIFPHWMGTPWDFNGTTQVPGEGKIACGYFVTTVLRHAGFRLQRVRLAQQAAEQIVKKLVSESNIRRFSDVPLDEFVSSVKDWGRGLYVVGLDCHVGFIVNDGSEVYFVHSTFVGPCMVMSEVARESSVLEYSRYRILGRITADRRLIRCWITGERANTTI